MYRVSSRLLGVLRGMRQGRDAGPGRDDTEHLCGSAVNEQGLNAAIAELNAGCGSLASMPDLTARLSDGVAR